MYAAICHIQSQLLICQRLGLVFIVCKSCLNSFHQFRQPPASVFQLFLNRKFTRACWEGFDHAWSKKRQCSDVIVTCGTVAPVVYQEGFFLTRSTLLTPPPPFPGMQHAQNCLALVCNWKQLRTTVAEGEH